MSEIPADTITERFVSKGKLEPGSLVFEADLKARLAFQSMELALFHNEARVDDISIYSFYIAPRGRGSYIKFQFSDHRVIPNDKYELHGTIHFWME